MVVTLFRYIGRWVVIEHDYERKKLHYKQKPEENGINALKRKIGIMIMKVALLLKKVFFYNMIL